MCLYLL